MTKLLKHIFALVFIAGIGCQSYGQYVRRIPPRFERRRYERVVEVQQNQNPQIRVENVKVNFIKQQLNLPPDQARKFFPLYREYQTELFNMLKLKRLNNTDAANGTDQIDKDMYYDTQIINIKQRFKNDFLQILPPEKVSELYKAEREFNDELVRSLSERGTNP